MLKTLLILFLFSGLAFTQTAADSTILNYLLLQHKTQFETVENYGKYVVVIQYKIENAKLEKLIQMIREEQLKLKSINNKTVPKGTWR